MRHHPIQSALFSENRQRLRALLPAGGMAIVNANDIPPTNADGTLTGVPNSDLFYLSGVEQEESILVIFPDAHDEKHREILFLRETSEHIAIWEGHKMTKPGARKASGIEHVMWLQDFPTIHRILMCQADTVFLNSNEHARAGIQVQTRDARFIQKQVCQVLGRHTGPLNIRKSVERTGGSRAAEAGHFVEGSDDHISPLSELRHHLGDIVLRAL